MYREGCLSAIPLFKVPLILITDSAMKFFSILFFVLGCVSLVARNARFVVRNINDLIRPSQDLGDVCQKLSTVNWASIDLHPLASRSGLELTRGRILRQEFGLVSPPGLLA